MTDGFNPQPIRLCSSASVWPHRLRGLVCDPTRLSSPAIIDSLRRPSDRPTDQCAGPACDARGRWQWPAVGLIIPSARLTFTFCIPDRAGGSTSSIRRLANSALTHESRAGAARMALAASGKINSAARWNIPPVTRVVSVDRSWRPHRTFVQRLILASWNGRCRGQQSRNEVP